MMLFTMAWRNIWRNKTRSAVIMLSVAIGLFAGIAVLSLYKGMMRSRVRTVIDREIGHLQVHHPEFKKDFEAIYTVPAGFELESFIRQSPATRAMATRSITQGMLATATGSSGVQVNGIRLPEENRVSGLDSKIIEGNLFDSNRHNQVIISKKLSSRMKIKLKGKVVLTFTDKENNITSGAFRVTGIFQTINTPLDERNVYVQQEDLNSLLGTGEQFHEAVVLLKNDEDLGLFQQAVQNKFPELLVENWKELSPETELLVTTSNQYMYIIIIIIMLALAFGIINTMLMAILERTRELGMITALGLNKVKLFTLVLYETILLTMAGTPLGIALAWLGTAYFSKKGIDISSVSREAMSSFGFESVIYPEFPYENIPAVMLIVGATSLLASVFPAIRALRLQPVEALRR